uniref:Uncharacterized protein n=1 Tax=Stomoxys calcitrans TaxID=35570 RepID=A0A1I8PT55_STOCA
MHLQSQCAAMSDFDKIESAITKKYEDGVKSALEPMNITELKDFYKFYQEEEKAIDDEEVGPVKNTPSLEMFAEIFKLLDNHPSNLQKPKPKAALITRDRMNSTISRSSTSSLNDLCTSASNSSLNQKDASNSSLNMAKFEENFIKPSETYSNFCKFQKQLKQITLEIEDQSIEKDYMAKLKQLNNFSQQLEKLLPKEKVGQSALTTEEENILGALVNKMDDLNCIRDNQGIFSQESNPIYTNSQRLDSLVDILSHCLIAANSFNIN